MSRTSSTSFLPTPCPVGPPRRASLSFASQDDTTTTIEYTRAFEPTLHAAKPRRRSSILPGQAARRTAAQPVTIFEDLEEDQELVVKEAQPRLQGKSLLGKPARKMAGGLANGGGGAAQMQTSREQSTVPSGRARTGLSEMRQPPSGDAPAARALRGVGQGKARRVSGMNDLPQPRSRMSMTADQVHASMAPRPVMKPTGPPPSTMKGSIKDAAKRRVTIYAPEDTTVMTLHPGANNTGRIDDTFFQLDLGAQVAPHQGENSNQEQEQSNLLKPIRRPRKSLMAAPKRMPFQQLDNFGNTEAFDVCGNNTGKENLPPGGFQKFKVSVSTSPEAVSMRTTTLSQPTAASRARQSIVPRDVVPLRGSPRSIGSSPSPKNPNRSVPPKPQVYQPNRMPVKPQLREVIAQKRSQLDMSRLKNYPVLSEGFTQLSLFENDWLSNQEVAITEVINEIFRSTPSGSIGWKTEKSLRTLLFELYDLAEVATLYSRLQASLVYGSLSAPASLVGKLKLSQDIGLRRQYITLLLDTYDEDALRAAAEVVVGRQIPSEPSSHCTSLDSKAGRRELVAFVETFFVQVGDIDATDALRDDRPDIDLVRWRKTMLRTLMLVWLLDQGQGAGVINGNLFKTKSAHKSSYSILRALANILLPTVGDLTRALKQMNYEVTHAQDPLDEVKYHISNLAIDLRDGVLLTRLVEILLHCRERPTKSYDETLTITLPDTTQLISEVFGPDLKRAQNMLSRHLKLPCISETQKMFNVQVALSALQHGGLHGRNVVGDITAKDLVNGHREKTMSFLWQLVGTFGLQHLVDWNVLASDITRVSGKAYFISFPSQQQETALLDWAAAHASDVSITNLSTDFANGKPYVAILNDFANYMPSLKADETSGTSKALNHQLQTLGCSEAFRKQLTATVGVTVPSKETTLSNLAFLASRLLPLTQQHHAASRIQKSWRASRMTSVMRNRITKIKVSRDCAAFAHARNREIDAAIVLQRAWRGVVEARMEGWNRDVAEFQILAKGFLVRKNIKRSQRNAFKEVVLGGW